MKYIHIEAIECLKKWKELWYAMAEQDTTRYKVLKASDVFEFWSLFDAWKEKLEALKSSREDAKRKRK